ncbi:MAG: SGNH/GDSL hydrolase family protein [Acidimicrobiales bacterium]|nr:SGNH/GDSL hydrolase family protein [Acidimicrobiales bacterium]
MTGEAMEGRPASRAAPAEDVVRTVVALVALAVLCIVAGAAVGNVESGATASASTPRPAPLRYDLALGDSLAAGVGASAPARGYVGLLYEHERRRMPGLRLVDLACPGATTTSFTAGGGCSYAQPSQLAAAEAFLRDHRSQVAFVTLDIGLNDVDSCMSTVEVDEACVADGLQQADRGLRGILAGVGRADPDAPVIGSDYYDPFLAAWADGGSGQSVALQSEVGIVALNGVLSRAYGDAGMAVAPVAARFATVDTDAGTTASDDTPADVRHVCAWTWMCATGNLHPNDAGYAQLAAAFAAVLPTRPVRAR